jgi:hypothetical protein
VVLDAKHFHIKYVVRPNYSRNKYAPYHIIPNIAKFRGRWTPLSAIKLNFATTYLGLWRGLPLFTMECIFCTTFFCVSWYFVGYLHIKFQIGRYIRFADLPSYLLSPRYLDIEVDQSGLGHLCSKLLGISKYVRHHFGTSWFKKREI